MDVIAVPRGHRHHQLRLAVDQLGNHGDRLLDVGAGDGWLAAGWNGDAVGLDVFAPDPKPVNWAVGSTDALPFADRSFTHVALLASLGAFATAGSRARALRDVRRVLRPGGHVVALASCRHRLADAIAPHRLRSRWRWQSFDADQLMSEFDAAGLDIVHSARYGGWRTVAVDWSVTVSAPLLRRRGRDDLLTRIGEWDANEFAHPSVSGRYLVLRAVAAP